VAAWLLTACGVALALIGAFFLTFAFTAAVLGGYIATAGILVVYVANTGVRSGDPGAIALVALSGVTSVGWMSDESLRDNRPRDVYPPASWDRARCWFRPVLLRRGLQ